MLQSRRTNMAKYIKPLPPQDYLLEALDYEPSTGELTWRYRPLEHFGGDPSTAARWNTRFAGKPAGTINYIGHGKPRAKVVLNYVSYHAGRIIWKMMIGNDPTEEIDHENTDKLDNRWDNLRESTRLGNLRNRSVRDDSASRLKGVYKTRSGRYNAYVTLSKRRLHLGTYDTAKEAHEVYLAVAKELHGEFFNPDEH
jgi:hypothetical protein